ncbi:MAG: DUF4397 domain-containing protein [Pedobacter sp.]|nr:MAG: DUF4397 domain-containing protein [Pedobacter sp.]
MTNFTSFLSIKSFRFLSYFALLALVGLSACKGEEELSPNASYLRFINMSPTLGTYNIYFDDTKLNTAAIPFGGTIAYNTYFMGAHTVKYTTASSTVAVLTKSISLDVDKIHSLYLIDKGDKMDVLMVTDNVGAISTTKGLVKFLNLSPDAPALTLDIKEGANIARDKTYKTGGEFVSLDPKKYTFEVKDAATGVVKATLTDIDVAIGRHYTIVARGMMSPGANEQAFSAQSLIN